MAIMTQFLTHPMQCSIRTRTLLRWVLKACCSWVNSFPFGFLTGVLTSRRGTRCSALVGIRLTPIRQALNGLEVIAQVFVVHLAGHRFADRQNMMRAVSDELGLERKTFFYPNSALCAWCSRSAARSAARWRQSARGDPSTALTPDTAQG